MRWSPHLPHRSHGARSHGARSHGPRSHGARSHHQSLPRADGCVGVERFMESLISHRDASKAPPYLRHLCSQPRQLLLLPEEFLQGVLQHHRQGLGRIVSRQLRRLLPSPRRFHLRRGRQLHLAPTESLLRPVPASRPQHQPRVETQTSRNKS